MVSYKTTGLYQVIAILAVSRICAAQFAECDKIVIEGGTNALKKIFMDFNDIKNTINDLKLSIEEYSKQAEVKGKVPPLFDIRYDVLPQKCTTEVLNKNCAQPLFDLRFDTAAPSCASEIVPKNCAEATSCTRRSGIYKMQVPQYSLEPFHVECDAETENGDWILIQRRQDGSEDFYRNWDEYEKGFGDVDKEFFIGLKKLHALTNYNGPQELLIIMEDANGTSAFAKYDTFAIGNDTEMYKLKHLGKYSGTAGDSLNTHLGMKFSTKDRDNDTHQTLNCAVNFTGAWWYTACHHSNLNGKYGDNVFGKGINWLAYRGHTVSLKHVKMMIRRRRINS